MRRGNAAGLARPPEDGTAAALTSQAMLGRPGPGQGSILRHAGATCGLCSERRNPGPDVLLRARTPSRAPPASVPRPGVGIVGRPGGEGRAGPHRATSSLATSRAPRDGPLLRKGEGGGSGLVRKHLGGPVAQKPIGSTSACGIQHLPSEGGGSGGQKGVGTAETRGGGPGWRGNLPSIPSVVSSPHPSASLPGQPALTVASRHDETPRQGPVWCLSVSTAAGKSRDYAHPGHHCSQPVGAGVPKEGEQVETMGADPSWRGGALCALPTPRTRTKPPRPTLP